MVCLATCFRFCIISACWCRCMNHSWLACQRLNAWSYAGSLKHFGRRGASHTVRDVDGSSGEGKLSKRGGASGYGSHEVLTLKFWFLEFHHRNLSAFLLIGWRLVHWINRSKSGFKSQVLVLRVFEKVCLLIIQSYLFAWYLGWNSSYSFLFHNDMAWWWSIVTSSSSSPYWHKKVQPF